MDNAIVSRLHAYAIVVPVVLALLVTNSLFAQGTIQYSWQGPVEMLPSAISLGGDTGEFRFNSIRSSNDKFVGLRAPQTLVNSYRMRFPEGPGSQDNCLKRGTGAAMSDNIYDYALYFGACAGEGQDWISAVQDGASNNHNSTVYSPNQGDRVGWRVIRSRGTVLAPENVLVNDYVSSEEYSALIGGSVFPVFGVKVIRTTNTPTSIGTMAFQTNDAAGVPYNKLIINDNVYIDNGHLGSSTIRVPKIWVHDFDCDGTGCGAGASGWTRDSTNGRLYPTVATDDVRITNKLQLQDNTASDTKFVWDIHAEIPLPALGTVKLVMRDNAGATVQEWERIFMGSQTNSNVSRLDMHFQPMLSSAYNLGSASRLWLNTYTTAVYTQGLHSTGGSDHINFGDHLLPTGAALQDIGEDAHRVRRLYVQDIDCTGACGHWYRNTAAGWVRPAVPTDDVRTRAKFVFEEPQFGVVTMDIQAVVSNPAAGTISMAFRDNAGAEMLLLQRQFLGTASNSALIDLHFEPKTGDRRLGGPAVANHWATVYGNDYYMTTVRPHSGGTFINSYAHWNPYAGDTLNLGGGDGGRWLKLWVKDIDAYGAINAGSIAVTNFTCTGSCPGQSYWTRNASSGFVLPATASDDVHTRAKFVFEDVGPPGGTIFMDIQATVSNPAAGTISMQFRDNAGAEMLRLQRRFLGSASNMATLDMPLQPGINSTLTPSVTGYNFGSSTRVWLDIWGQRHYMAHLRPVSGVDVISFANLIPDASVTYNLGSPTKPWSISYVFSTYTNGIAGTTSSGTNPGQVLMYGHFIPSQTTTYTLGTAAVRWNYVYTANLDTTNFSVSSLSVTTLTVSGNSTIGGTLGVSSTLTVGSTLTTRRVEPFSDAQYSLGGSTSLRYTNLYLSSTAFVGGLAGTTGSSAISVQSALVPSAGGTHDSGSSTARWKGGYFQDVNVSASITANGSVAKSGTYTINGGCFFTFSLGIMTNTNC